METTEIVSVEAQKKIAESTELAEQYRDFSITAPQGYANAGGVLKAVKGKAKELDDLRKSLTKPLDESKKRIMELFRTPLEVLAGVESAIKRAMINWQKEQEAIRLAEEKRLAEIQRKETERLEKEARLAEEKASKLKTEKAKLAAEEKAKDLREKAAAVSAIAPTVKSKVEAVQGVSTRKTWKCKVVDVDKIPREYLIPDAKLLNAIAAATKGTKVIPGVEFYSEDVMVTRR